MSVGYYEFDEHARRHFRPIMPELPRLDDVADVLLPASEKLREFDLRLSQVQGNGMIGRLFARLDAVHSSGAEGSTTTFTELMEFDSVPTSVADPEDAAQIAACAEAFEHLGKIHTETSMAVLVIHHHMFSRSKDRFKAQGAGKFKEFSNSTYDPDEPADRFFYTLPKSVVPALTEWNALTMASDPKVPELVRQAVSHWMFEHIHPVHDGNGRVGRLLVPLVMKWKRATSNACAFLGEAVHEDKEIYIEGLKASRRTENMTPFTRLFLGFISRNAEANLSRLNKLLELRSGWQRETSGYRAGSLIHRLVPWAATNPAFTVNRVAKEFSTSFPTANDAIAKLVSLGIAELSEEKARDRLFVVPDVLDIFDRFRIKSVPKLGF